MLASAPLPSPPPIEARVIFIVGATGCGKSRLSVDLALALAAAHSASAEDGGTHQCEIVSADSKQVFRGLDIGSAKTTLAEQRGVRHHLTDCLAPHAPFSVAEFRRAAAASIADICARGRTPIVVGGTFYYVESLLFPAHAIRTDGEASASSSSSAEQREVATAPARLAHSASLTSSDSHQTFNHDAVTTASENQSTIPAPATCANHAPTTDAYARLCEVDPIMARKLHPNDSRKIARALQGVCTKNILSLPSRVVKILASIVYRSPLRVYLFVIREPNMPRSIHTTSTRVLFFRLCFGASNSV